MEATIRFFSLQHLAIVTKYTIMKTAGLKFLGPVTNSSFGQKYPTIFSRNYVTKKHILALASDIQLSSSYREQLGTLCQASLPSVWSGLVSSANQAGIRDVSNDYFYFAVFSYWFSCYKV